MSAFSSLASYLRTFSFAWLQLKVRPEVETHNRLDNQPKKQALRDVSAALHLLLAVSWFSSLSLWVVVLHSCLPFSPSHLRLRGSSVMQYDAWRDEQRRKDEEERRARIAKFRAVLRGR